MSQIKLGTASTGEQVFIDIPTLITTRMLVTASSGGGKSETLRRILEEACEHVQCIVIDPEGEFSTLRERKPFVLVGEGGETTADLRTASLVATRLLELNVSAVCDLYEMRVQDRHEWVKRFLDSMVHAPKSLWHPVLVILDEAHSFAPEKGYSDSVALQSVTDMANLGRKRGFALIPATQRISKLSKNVVEPMQNYLLGRTTFDDQERAARIFKVKPGAETRQFSLELENLADGQFICRGRAFNGDMLKVQVQRGQTRAPATGTAMAGLTTPTPAAVKALLPKLADLPKEVERKQRSEEDLRSEISELKRQLSARPSTDQSAINDLTRRLESSEAWARGVAGAADSRGHALSETASKLEQIALDLRMHVSGEQFAPLAPAATEPPAPIPQRSSPRPIPSAQPTLNSKPSMPRACRLILTALSQHGQCTKARIAALTGYSSGGGGFNNALSECRTREWIRGADKIGVTSDGVSALGPVDPLPTGDELLSMWGAKLGKAEREILNALAFSRGMPKEDLANVTGYAANGGRFNNAISRLRTLELIEGRAILQLTADFASAVRS